MSDTNENDSDNGNQRWSMERNGRNDNDIAIQCNSLKKMTSTNEKAANIDTVNDFSNNVTSRMSVANNSNHIKRTVSPRRDEMETASVKQSDDKYEERSELKYGDYQDPSGSIDATTPLLSSGQHGSILNGCCNENLFIYVSHFLSAWGDRMWTFAVGLFLVEITPESLLLTAVFGLTMGISVLLFGPLAGEWVDDTPRLKAARVSLILQNLLVILCSGLVYAFLVFKTDFLSVGDWMRYVVYGGIIVLASLANLASIANTIAVEKDWIVEISGGDDDRLAAMTATMKVIDLTTKILAPIATGQVMTYASVANAALFIAGWNVLSLVGEYYLVWKVYVTVPALRKRKDFVQNKGKEEKGHTQQEKESAPDDKGGDQPIKRRGLLSNVMAIVDGWKTFTKYHVFIAGICLSMLYMTVLGYDNVTVGYAKIQGLSDSVLGILMGAGGVVGILGTISYPTFRRSLGLPKAALVALMLEALCLSACVVSLWLPGSPFDLNEWDPPQASNCSAGNETASDFPSVDFNDTTPTPAVEPCSTGSSSLISVIVLMAGIVTARFGLWIADLSITQMFMETIVEKERGVVFGVQNSLNQLMDMLKFGLVVALPLANQFGYLVIISFLFVTSSGMLYTVFLCRPSATQGRRSSDRIAAVEESETKA